MSSFSSSFALSRLQSYVNVLSRNPYGRNLLSEANRRGIRISYAPTEPGVLGFFRPSTNTIVLGDKTIRDPELGLSILSHELVHAVTPEDGNSRNEEGLAFVIGEIITSQIYGRSIDRNRLNRLYFDTAALYPDLPAFNTGFNENITRILNGGSFARSR